MDLLNRLRETEENKKELIELMMLMRIPMSILGFPEGSLQLIQQAERVAKELGETRHLANLYSAMGAYYTQAGDHLTALRYTKEAFEKARTSNDIELVVPLGYSLCLTYGATGMRNKIVDKIPDVIDLIEKSGRESDFFATGLHPYSYLCTQCGQALWYLGHFEQGEVFLEKGLRSAIQVGDLASLGAAELGYGHYLIIKSEWESAKNHYEEGLKYCEEAKWHLGTAVALIRIGYLCSLLGNPENGKRHAEKGLQIYREIKVEIYLSWCTYLIGLIHLDLGTMPLPDRSPRREASAARKFEGGSLWPGIRGDTAREFPTRFALLPVWRSGRRRRLATASPPDGRKRANWYLERSPAPSLVRHFPGFLPGSSGRPWLESLAFERRLAKPERFGILALAKDLSKALFHHGTDGRPLAGGHIARFLQQCIRYLYGRLHTAICIRLYVEMSSAD
jgi:tetratricopeptide (TPR) repeat protein